MGTGAELALYAALASTVVSGVVAATKEGPKMPENNAPKPLASAKSPMAGVLPGSGAGGSSKPSAGGLGTLLTGAAGVDPAGLLIGRNSVLGA